MLHPHTEIRYINNAVGYGVIATQFIPKGTITWILDKLDRFFTPRQIKEMDPLYQEVLEKYTYRNAEGDFILCWDNARFINHSSDSNCLTTAYEFELAIRDIHPGEELTDDYGYLNIEAPFESLTEEGERKIVYPDDLVRYHYQWDAKLLDGFKHFNSCPQPLLHLLGDGLAQKINRIASGEEKMESILYCYHNLENLNGKSKVLKHQHHEVTYPF
jgi:uncharacterized protein